MMERSVPATIKNDPRKHANLPTEVIIQDYPSCSYMDQYLDDTLVGIDKQIDHDVMIGARQMSRKKY